MITLEGLTLLGRAPETCPSLKVNCTPPLPKGIPDTREVDVGDPGLAGWSIKGTGSTKELGGFRLLVATDPLTRQRAFRLAYSVYRDSGYVMGPSTGQVQSPFDADPRTLVLLIEDSQGQEAATVSLVFDSPAGLPCDSVYETELEALRMRGRHLVEVTRLAIGAEYAGAKTLLVHLFNFISVYARRIEKSTDFIIEVNPRHVNYYRRLLLFEPAGTERYCPRVNDAPVMLLRLDLAIQEREIERVGGSQGQVRGEHGRTLYSFYYAFEDEPRIANFLMRSKCSIVLDEFGINN